MDTIKTVKITAVVLLSLVALVLSASLGYVIYEGADGMKFGGQSGVVFDETVEADGLESVRVECESDDIILYKSQDQNIRVIQYGKNLAEDELVNLNKTGDKLEIKRDRKFRFFSFLIFNRSERVEVYLPENYAKSLELKSTSGDILLKQDFVFSNLNIQGVSGEVETSNLQCETLNISSTSGDIELGSVNGNYNLTTVSGELSVHTARGAGSMKSTSGDISLNNMQMSGDSSIKTISGEIGIGIQKDSIPSITAKTTSGDVDSDLPVTKSGGRYEMGQSVMQYSLELSTVSGDIQVKLVD